MVKIHLVLSCKRNTLLWSIILSTRTRSLVSLVICNQDILSPSHATMQPLSVGLKRICRFHIYKALLCSSIVTPWSTLKSVLSSVLDLVTKTRTLIFNCSYQKDESATFNYKHTEEELEKTKTTRKKTAA